MPYLGDFNAGSITKEDVDAYEDVVGPCGVVKVWCHIGSCYNAAAHI